MTVVRILRSLGDAPSLRRVSVSGRHAGCIQRDPVAGAWSAYPVGAARPIGTAPDERGAARLLTALTTAA